MLRGALVTGAGTLISRFLGMLRDMATAAMLGMSSGGVMDAFVFAFRLPDVARRMFGEGAVSISFIPEFTKLWQEDREKAGKLFSLMLCWVFVILVGFVLLGELTCWAALQFFETTSKVFLAAHLLSVMLPYLVLICMAAVCAAALQTLGRFAVVTTVPMILNIVWLFAILAVAPRMTDDPAMRCYILALSVLAAGFLQFLVQCPLLRRLGVRFLFDPKPVASTMRTILRNTFPTMIGLMTIQLNLLAASMLAWALSGPQGTSIRWLGRVVEYPLHAGAVAAIYYSERLFEFPQGMIGLALASTIYPLISRHAAKKDYRALSDDLGLAVRLQFILGIPAGAGLMLLSGRLAHLLYQRGAFTPADTARTADMIFCFGLGVWAFCAIPVMVRGFFAIGDIRTPLRVGLGCGLLNVLLCLGLIWPFREQGIALAVTSAAALQAVALVLLYSRKHGILPLRPILLSVARALAAAFIMSVAVVVTMKAIPGSDSLADILHIAAAGIVGLVVYILCFRIFGGHELSILMRGRERERGSAAKFRARNRRRRNRKRKSPWKTH